MPIVHGAEVLEVILRRIDVPKCCFPNSIVGSAGPPTHGE